MVFNANFQILTPFWQINVSKMSDCTCRQACLSCLTCGFANIETQSSEGPGGCGFYCVDCPCTNNHRYDCGCSGYSFLCCLGTLCYAMSPCNCYAQACISFFDFVWPENVFRKNHVNSETTQGDGGVQQETPVEVVSEKAT